MDERTNVSLTDAQRLDWLRLIRSENVGPRGHHGANATGPDAGFDASGSWLPRGPA